MGKRLLLADDSITIQKVVAIIFANEEFELTIVDNGISALERAREIRPDVMLVDALMPGKTGYEVCAEIRRDPRLCSTPILLLIGAFENPDDEEARSCGADASISKPFESQQLIDRVRELLEQGESRYVPPAESPLPPAAAAQELWGDLSCFDTMPPVSPPPAPEAAASLRDLATEVYTAPAAASFTPPPPAATPFAPSGPQPPTTAASGVTSAVPGDTPQTSLAVPPGSSNRQSATFEEDIVEAGLEDDLWGAFEVEEEQKRAPVGFTAPFAEPEPELEAEEFFSFEDESEAIEETGPPLDMGGEEEETVVLRSDEELFSFADDLSFTAPPDMEPLVLTEYEPLPFAPENATEIVVPEVEEAVVVEPVPPAWDSPSAWETPPAWEASFGSAAPSASEAPSAWEVAVEPLPVLEPQSSPVSPTPGAAAMVGEAELKAALSRISREVIERIVWEVVPDLAESLIKEEIRKLKAGIRG